MKSQNQKQKPNPPQKQKPDPPQKQKQDQPQKQKPDQPQKQDQSQKQKEKQKVDEPKAEQKTQNGQSNADSQTVIATAGDLLVKEYVYSQTFAIHETKEKQFESQLDEYVRYMLNDLGLFFYKATWFVTHEKRTGYKNLEGRHRIFAIDFYLYTYDHFIKETHKKSEIEKPEFLREHLDKDIDYSKAFKSKIYFEQKTILRKPDFSPKEMPASDYTGPISGLSWDSLKMGIYWWLIVPKVQYAFFDIMYQIYCFDLAHQGWIPKFFHMFTIPGNVIFSLSFLCQFPLFGLTSFGVNDLSPFTPTVGFLVASILALLYLISGVKNKCPTWGVSTAIVVYLLWLLAALWLHTFGVSTAPWYNPTGSLWTNPLILMYLCSEVESFSHIIVPQLPPYITGVNHWESPLAFFRTGKPFYIFMSLISAFTFSPLVSYISWPHLIGNMILYILFSIGYNSDYYEEYHRMVQKAELTGNPSMDDIPKDFHDLIHGVPGNSGTPNSKKNPNPIWSIMYFTHVQSRKYKEEFKVPSLGSNNGNSSENVNVSGSGSGKTKKKEK